MSTSRPTQVTLFISIALAVLALLITGGVFSLPISPFMLLAIAYIVLLIGVLFKNA
jgi:hypothetical protein